MLTRKEMEAVIKTGGSVIHKGQIISRIDDLPKAAELAKGDPAKEAATLDDIDAQIAALQAQRATLAPAQPEGPYIGLGGEQQPPDGNPQTPAPVVDPAKAKAK